MDKALVVFQNKKIRRIWFNDEWWFSVVDIVEVLTETARARKYWADLKKKLIDEGFQLSEKIGQLKVLAADGKATFGMTPSEYKDYKGLDKENLRDHMNDLELIFSMLGERVSTEITRQEDAQGYQQVEGAARRGGRVAGNARKETERELGRPASTKENYLLEPEKRKRLGRKDKK